MTTQTSIYEYAKQGLALSADKPAVWFYGKSMTYGELFSCIDHVADHLAALGVGQGTAVTIHLPNCPQAVMAIYAVAKLGGICNMVHPQVPLEGLRENMAFTESNILITGDHFSQCGEVDFADKLIFVSLAAHMGTAHGLVYSLKNGVKRPDRAIPFEKLERPARIPADVPEQSSLAEKCAVYLHSSGTTGTPKTVMHCHRALNCWVESAKVYYQGTDTTKQICLSVIPPFHGIGLVMKIHRVISCGGQQILLARWSSKTAVRLIKKRKVTVLVGVPAMYRSLLECKAFSGPRIRQIQECFTGGDRTDSRLKREIDHRIGGKHHLFEAYGLTETVTACTSISVSHYKDNASGYPLDQCHLAVLDRNGVMHTEGEGELAASTNTMMMGYLKDPKATEANFFERNGRRWIRTGDYGRIDKDGFVYFQERLKHTIIHKGYNIYPSEVEKVIQRIPGVQSVCVVGVMDQSHTTQQIRACVILADGASQVAVQELIEDACTQELPRYAHPNQTRFLTEFPLNQIGKIDYRALENLA